MMRQVLVLDNNPITAERLSSTLKQIPHLSVCTVPTVREACLIVAQSSQDMVFMPMVDSDQPTRTLRSFQPNLRIILVTADIILPVDSAPNQNYQGILHLSRLEEELPGILGQLNIELELIEESQTSLENLPKGFNRLGEISRKAGVGEHSGIEMALLSSGGRLINHYGDGSESQVYHVVEILRDTWKAGKLTGQIQYLQLPDQYDPRLVFSCPAETAVLTLVAGEETSLREVRRTADYIVQQLREGSGAVTEPYFKAVESTNGHANGAVIEKLPRNNYVITWQPIKPMPGLLQTLTRTTLDELATANNMSLSYVSVTADFVHLVVACPPGKTAAWAAFVLKMGITDEIQRRFKVNSTIWRKGFFASESKKPLPETELNLILAR